MDFSTDLYVGHDEIKSTDLMKRYNILGGLGNGAFATVYKARPSFCSTNCIVALKIMVMDQIAQRLQEKRKHDNKNKGGGGWSFVKEEEDDTDQLFFPSRLDNDILFTSCRMHTSRKDIVEVQNMVKREIEVHQLASLKTHPNIVRLVESFHYRLPTKNSSVCAIALEYCTLGDLHHYMKKMRGRRKNRSDKMPLHNTFLSENETRHVLTHVLRGLAYIHSLGIVHRDIKPGNIFISLGGEECRMGMRNGNMVSLLDCILKIGDFGLAVKMSDDDDWDEANYTLCGTPSCLAPEVALFGTNSRVNAVICPKDEFSDHCRHEGLSRTKGYGQPADLWSTGCLMYVMLCGQYPFSRQVSKNCTGESRKEERIRETIDRVLDGRWSIPDDVKVSIEANTLLSCLLSKNPKDRGFARGLLSTQPFLTPPTHLPHARQCSLYKKHFTGHFYANSPCPLEGVHSISNARLKNLGQKSLNSQGVERFYSNSPASLKGIEFSKHDNHLLEKITDLPFIFPGRYAWEETTKSDTKLFLDMFVLPKRLGVVIQCKRISHGSNITGIWMHLSGSGSHVCVGKLANKGLPTFVWKAHSNLPCDPISVRLVNNAFTRRPRKYKCHPTLVEQKNIGNDQKWNLLNSCSMNSSSLQSTIYSKTSSIAGPQRAIEESAYSVKKLYKPLSALLVKKYDSCLAIYRLMKKYLNKISEMHSCFCMHIHICTSEDIAKNERGSHICSVTTVSMNNSKYFKLNFEDSLEIRYSPSTETGEVRSYEENSLEVRIEEIHFSTESQSIALVSPQKSQKYPFHLRFAYEAIQKSLEYFEGNFIITNKMPIIVEARGSSSNEWHIVSENHL